MTRVIKNHAWHSINNSPKKKTTKKTPKKLGWKTNQREKYLKFSHNQKITEKLHSEIPSTIKIFHTPQ